MVANNRRTTHPRTSQPANLHNKIAVVVIKDFQVVSCILSQNYLWVTWCFITQRGSVVCKITGRWTNRKSLEIPCKNIYYYGFTEHMAFIFVITVFPQPQMRPGVYTRVAVI